MSSSGCASDDSDPEYKLALRIALERARLAKLKHRQDRAAERLKGLVIVSDSSSSDDDGSSSSDDDDDQPPAAAGYSYAGDRKGKATGDRWGSDRRPHYLNVKPHPRHHEPHLQLQDSRLPSPQCQSNSGAQKTAAFSRIPRPREKPETLLGRCAISPTGARRHGLRLRLLPLPGLPHLHRAEDRHPHPPHPLLRLPRPPVPAPSAAVSGGGGRGPGGAPARRGRGAEAAGPPVPRGPRLRPPPPRAGSPAHHRRHQHPPRPRLRRPLRRGRASTLRGGRDSRRPGAAGHRADLPGHRPPVEGRRVLRVHEGSHAMGRLIKSGWGRWTPVDSGSEIGDKRCGTRGVPRFGALRGR